MASTGTAVYPSTSLYPGSSVYPGQGSYPIPVVLYSLSDASVAPTWVSATDYLRGFQTSRGRATELARVDAGTATITLDNRTRLFDPAVTSGIRPMNRWRIMEQFSGETQDIFNGYAESYTQVWPDKLVDAVTVVSCVDEMKVLALDRLPTTDPPRDTYADVVQFDKPHAYWRFAPTGAADYRQIQPTVGPADMSGPGFAGEDSPIIGDYSEVWTRLGTIVGSNALETATYYRTCEWTSFLETGVYGIGDAEPGNMAGLSSFTFELWFKSSEAAPASARTILIGPDTGGTAYQYSLVHNTTGTITATTRGSATYTANGATALAANTWYHVALTVGSGVTTLYVNGVSDGTDSYAGTFAAMAAGAYTQLGTDTAVGGTRYYDEPAIYRLLLPAARILAHYEAGALRAFPIQDPGARINAVLALADTTAPSSIRAGSREMTPQYQTGQDPLSELRRAEAADAVDAVLFIARDGTITFLDDGHRSSSPWSTVQATFDDDGTDLPYTDIQIDYSESFLANEWNVTKSGGTISSASDTTSIARYFKRLQSLPELSITTTADADAIAAAMLAKYKDPMTRITRVTAVTANPEVAEDLFRLDIGSRIRIFRTPPGGGSRIDQTSFVQSIEVTADRSSPVWTITLGVSPL